MCDAIRRGGHGWWYRGRQAALRALGTRVKCAPRGRGLDYGAGFGDMYPVFTGCDTVDAYEVLPEGRAACTTRGYAHVHEEEGGIRAGTYDHIGLFDVLEHIEDDEATMRYIYDLLTPGGVVIGTVPAYPFLFGKHDAENNHYRRYMKRGLAQMLTRAGFTVRAISYWNTTLFPVALLLRLLGRASGASLHPSPCVDTVLGAIVTTEARLLRYLSLPCGLSVTFVAQKKP